MRGGGRWTVVALMAALWLAGCSGTGDAVSTTPTPTAEGTVETLYVDSQRATCQGMVERQCLQTRESPDEPWGHFYTPIEGFDFEPGYRYTLRVRVTPIATPMADASSLRYELIEVVDKNAAP